LSDYGEKWGFVYNMFHRVNMHAMLMDSSTSEKYSGIPAVLKVDHKCVAIDHEKGSITFENGVVVQHDLIIGSDGAGVSQMIISSLLCHRQFLPDLGYKIKLCLTSSLTNIVVKSTVRKTLNIEVDRKESTSTCYHCIIDTVDVKKLGLKDLTKNSAIEFWGGQGINKIVYSPCREGEVNSFYCFFPKALATGNSGDRWTDTITLDSLLKPFPDLDPELLALFRNSTDIKPWRLFVHQPYSHWRVGRTTIMGDAAHPMMPDQSQGACQAIEDAAALGIVFGKKYNFTSNVNAGLQVYEAIRKPRASRVQAASARARENITERIGFSSNVDNPLYKVTDEKQKLTIEEMNQ
jgi:salicylate hydroxylase